MNKEKILAEIKRTALINGGRPLGRERFELEMGIKESSWSGKFWSRWSDAVSEAGLTPNQMNQPTPEKELVRAVAELTRELGHFPTQPEMRLKRRNDVSFPSPDSILRRLGRKDKIASLIVEFSSKNPDFSDVAEICQSIAESQPESGGQSNLQKGHVYLLRHGTDYKIGKSSDPTRRYKEIRVQMPLETEEIHQIKTDDISGIEAYWHNRFKDKRLNGEWFRLSKADVLAFKKRKFM